MTSSNNQLKTESYSEESNSIYSDLKIIDQQANYVELPNGYYSYTFNTYRENTETDKLENIVLVSNGVDEFNAFYVEYTITDQEREKLREGNSLSDIENKSHVKIMSEGELENIIQNRGTLDDCYDFRSLYTYRNGCIAIGLINSCSGELKVIYEIDCNTSGEILDSEGLPGGGGGGFDWSNWGFPNPNPGFTGGGGAGSFTPGGTTTTNPEDGNDNNSNTGTSNEIGDILVTNPNIRDLEPNDYDPCDSLKEKSEESKFQENVNYLKEKLEQGSEYEHGFANYNNSENPHINSDLDNQYQPSTGNQPHSTGSPQLGSSSTFGAGHLHRDGDDIVGIFSVGDIRVFYGILHRRLRRGFSLENTYVTVVSSHGVYALKLEKKENLINNFYSKNVNARNEIFNTMERIYQRDALNNGFQTDDEVERLIAKTLKRNFNSLGISVYKANDDLSSWSKLKYKGTLNPVEKIPCN